MTINRIFMILSLISLALFMLLGVEKVHADSQICQQFGNNRIECQNYNDQGYYENNTYYQRTGNTNNWNGVTDGVNNAPD